MPIAALTWVLAAPLWFAPAGIGFAAANTGVAPADIGLATPANIGLARVDAGLDAPNIVRAVVSGRVTDADTGQPLSGAEVFISGQTTSVFSDDAGTYAFILPGDGWEGREIRMRAVLAGYTRVERTLRLFGAAVRVDLPMTPGDDGIPGGLPGVQAFTIPRSPGGQVAVSARVGAVQAQERLVEEPRPGFNTESYAFIDEAGFLGVADNPLSTFGIDVDRASYSNMRRFLTRGMRPPVDAIRVEELVNYFTYDYPAPAGDHPFSVTTDVGAAPWQPEHRLVRIGIQGREIASEDLPPGNLVFLVDVSGSMEPPAKLPLLKSSLRLLVARMRPRDRVAIVVYAGEAGLSLPPTSGSNKSEILHAIDRLRAGGSTAGGAGIRLAYEVARENFSADGNNRVILASDGDFNVGPSSDAEMIRLIEKEREAGVFLSVLGFGTGNLKDSMMERLAGHGNGNYAYIDGEREAAKVLVSEFAGTMFTIAKDVKVQVEFNPREVRSYRLIGYENRALRAEDFADDRRDAGELGAGHSVTALYEVVPVGVEGPGARELPPLRYRDRGEVGRRAASGEMGFVQLRYKRPQGSESSLLEQILVDGGGDGSPDLRFAASVAAFGMLLRESEHAGEFSLGEVIELARASMGEDEEGYRREFIELVRKARERGVIERRERRRR